jgi:hypothetical protein
MNLENVMKKVIFCMLVMSGFVSGANAAPRYLERDGAAAYNVTYDYYDAEKSGWYATLRAEINFLNWTNEYSSDYAFVNDDFNKDDYSFEPIFGGSVSVGKRFSYFWRAEVEAGYTGNFEDADSGIAWNMSTPYAMANIMYDFNGGNDGVYVGGGLGVAFPMTTLDWDGFVPDARDDMGVSPMAGLMIGYSRALDYNFTLDLRYRLAGFMGTEQTRNFQDNSNNTYYLNVDTGLILENSLSVALRYNF